MKPLGEVCEIIGGGTPSKKVAAYYGGEIPWATVGDMNVEQLIATDLRITPAGLENSSARVIPSGNVIIATRVGLGKSCILNEDTAINQDLKGLVPKGSIGLLPRFLFRWTQSIAPRIIGAGTGATVQGVKIKFVSQLPIPVPSIEEQERIVEVLDEAFAAIDKAKANAERNLTNARELFQSRLNDIFSNPSEDWEVKPLGEVCDFVRGPFGGSLKKNCFVESGYAVYEQKHPIHGDFSSFRYFINSEKFEEMRRFEVEPGNVLMSCSGTIGRTKVVPEGAPKGIINQALLNLKPKEGLAPLFLKKWMESIDFLVQIEERSAGAALKNVASVKILKTIEVRIPPFGEQVQICEKLDEFAAMTKAVETQYQSELDNLEELRQSILEQAFEGKLTEPVAA